MSDKVKKGSGAPKKDSWHPHYNDPVHKLVLKSTDNVLFRVSAYHLAKASPVFAEMFDLALEVAEPVDMLVSTKVLCEFVYCTTCPYNEAMCYKIGLTLDEAFDLYHLGIRFECSIAKETGFNQIFSACYEPDMFWRGLVRASNENDERLAKNIVRRMRRECLDEVDPFPHISRLQPTWQHSLLRSTFGIVPHRQFQLDMKKYQGLPGDFNFQRSDKTHHRTMWQLRWNPNGKSDAKLDKDRGYVFPFETAEKPEHHASMARDIKVDAIVPIKQQDGTHTNISDEKIVLVGANKSGNNICSDQHSTQQNPSARTSDQTSMLSTPEYPSTDPSAHHTSSQAVEQTSLSPDILARANKRTKDIEESRRTKAQRTSSDIDPQVIGQASSGSTLIGYWRFKVRPSGSQRGS